VKANFQKKKLRERGGEFLEEDKWDKDKMKKAMKDSKEEFIDLNKKLVNVMVDFGLRALKTFQTGKNEPLNPLQVNQIVTHEIDAVIETLSEPHFADLIIQKVERDFYEGSSQPF